MNTGSGALGTGMALVSTQALLVQLPPVAPQSALV